MAEKWKWLNYPDGRKLLAAADRAVIHCPGPGPQMTVSEEDQTLIAATPSLLTACEAASRAMVNEIGMESEHRQCVAAIAEARGRL